MPSEFYNVGWALIIGGQEQDAEIWILNALPSPCHWKLSPQFVGLLVGGGNFRGGVWRKELDHCGVPLKGSPGGALVSISASY